MGSSKGRPIRRLFCIFVRILFHRIEDRPPTEAKIGNEWRDQMDRVCKGQNSLDVENGVLRVHSSLVLGGLTDQTLLVGERDEGGGSVATLVVGNWISG